jgi:hypothetical protein
MKWGKMILHVIKGFQTSHAKNIYKTSILNHHLDNKQEYYHDIWKCSKQKKYILKNFPKAFKVKPQKGSLK